MEGWEVLNERCVYENLPWLVIKEQEVRLPDGTVIPDYLLTEVPDVAMIFALTEAGEVLFVEQYKHGLKRSVWDLPAGYIDAGEDPFAAALRELEEETGYTGGSWRELAVAPFDTNRHNHQFYYYLAEGVRPDGAQHFDATEDIRVHKLPVAEVLPLLESDSIGGMHSSYGILRGLLATGFLAKP